MHGKETITAGAVATTAMTAFSYAASAVKGKNFKEPLLLSLFLEKLAARHHPLLRLAGWPLHYSLGCLWAGVYTLGAERLQHKVTCKQALGFGFLSGTVGVIIWRELFRRLPHPKTAYTQFYRQLFLAHLVFALSLWAAYPLLKRKRPV